MKLYQVWLVALLAFCLVGCSPNFELIAQKRMEYARQNQGDIQIVAMQDVYKSKYLNGILLAAEEINQRPNKLLGRTLTIEIEQDGKSFEETKPIIRRIASNPKITAVLGHRSSSIAVPASVIYERSQILFLPPFSTAQELTGHNFQYVFRMMPNASVMAEQIASVAHALGYRNIAVLYARDELNREQAFLFEDAAVQEGIKLVQNSSFFEKDDNYRPLISQFKGKAFDAVFIASSAAAGAKMVRQLREMGIDKPILGNDSFNLSSYTEDVGDAGNKTIVPVVYRQNEKNPYNTIFKQKYQEKYKTDPDYNAAQGYDSMMLLAATIEKANSTVPPLLSSTLHYMPATLGTTGLNAYSLKGDPYGKQYVFNVWQRGKFYSLPAIHIPYLLGRFENRLLSNQESEPQTSKEPTTFIQAFSQNLNESDHHIYLLELAQAILQFKRIGIIYEATESGKAAAGYSIVKQVADKKELEVIGCEIPFSVLGQDKIRQELVACYGKLSLNADVIFIADQKGINQDLVNQLNQSMLFFKVPSIYIGKAQDNINSTLILGKRTDVDPQGRGDMAVYQGLLNNIKVHELAERLQGLPEITVNLKNLQRLGLSDKALLDLSPDSFIDDRVKPGIKAETRP